MKKIQKPMKEAGPAPKSVRSERIRREQIKVEDEYDFEKELERKLEELFGPLDEV